MEQKKEKDESQMSYIRRDIQGEKVLDAHALANERLQQLKVQWEKPPFPQSDSNRENEWQDGTSRRKTW